MTNRPAAVIVFFLFGFFSAWPVAFLFALPFWVRLGAMTANGAFWASIAMR